MTYVSVKIDADEVLDELSDHDLMAEIDRRIQRGRWTLAHIGNSSPIPVDLESIALQISTGNHPAAIEMTKEYIYQSCGRIVN